LKETEGEVEWPNLPNPDLTDVDAPESIVDAIGDVDQLDEYPPLIPTSASRPPITGISSELAYIDDRSMELAQAAAIAAIEMHKPQVSTAPNLRLSRREQMDAIKNPSGEDSKSPTVPPAFGPFDLQVIATATLFGNLLGSIWRLVNGPWQPKAHKDSDSEQSHANRHHPRSWNVFD
jgi:hypothetical protein